MTTIQQNLLNLNNQPLMIGDFSVRQDEDGRYCLNDLHKASGGLEKHKPTRFVRNQQTQELITEIELENNQRPNMVFAIKTFHGGINSGTYVVEDLVYSYAMWISAKFHLMVIRAYRSQVADMLVEQSKQLQTSAKTTKQERVPLKDAVNLLVAKSKFLNYPDAYGLVHQRFDVNHISEIPYDQIPTAVEYIHHLIGEYIPHVERIDPELKALELLSADIVNKVHDYMYALSVEIKRLKGKLPDYPTFDKEAIARAVVTRIVQGQRMLLNVSYLTGKPEITFLPSDSWILDSQSIAKVIGDREGPKKELLPDIIEAAVKRLSS